MNVPRTIEDLLSAPTPRDPRIDPRPGDVVELDATRIRVTYVDEEVFAVRPKDDFVETLRMPLRSWRRLVAEAKVINPPQPAR